MVYKIRNKSFFFTLSGYKNNYSTKVLNAPTDIKPDLTFTVKSFDGGPEFIRFHQLYRNISRKCKQYVYGNKESEEHIMNVIREFFRIPHNSTTPIHLIQSEPLRRFLNQGDRDYELISNNSHPYQLDFYKSINENLQQETENLALRDEGKKTLEEQFVDVLSVRMKQLQDDNNGELPFEAIHDAMSDVYSLYVSALGAKAAKTPTGDFNDFLEVRRPFVDPGVTGANVKTQ